MMNSMGKGVNPETSVIQKSQRKSTDKTIQPIPNNHEISNSYYDLRYVNSNRMQTTRLYMLMNNLWVS